MYEEAEQIYLDLREAGYITEDFEFDIFKPNSKDVQLWCDLGEEGWSSFNACVPRLGYNC